MPSKKLNFAQGDKETDTHTHMNWCAHLPYKDLNTQLHFTHQNKTAATIHIYFAQRDIEAILLAITPTQTSTILSEIPCLLPHLASFSLYLLLEMY